MKVNVVYLFLFVYREGERGHRSDLNMSIIFCVEEHLYEQVFLFDLHFICYLT